MDLLREYWWIAAIVVALVVAFLLLRPRQRVKLTDSAPARAHMAYAKPREGRGLAGEHAAAASDVAGDIISAPVHGALDGRVAGDDLCLIKGIGPKFAVALHELGFNRFEQIAGLTRDRDRAARPAARRLPRPHRARPDRRAGRLSRPQRYRRVRTEVREALADRFGWGWRRLAPRARGDELVDLAAVEVDDLELPAVMPKGLADLGQMLEHR